MLRWTMILMAFLGVMSTEPSLAKTIQQPPVYSDFQGYAIKGYDPVAYFTDNRPVKGNPAFSHEWNGATWLFASAEHRDMFAADPERWAPQYGGYCAMGIAKGHTASIDPDYFRIIDGKLYLNLNKDIQEKWLENPGAMITRANNNWPKVLILNN